VLVIGDVVGHDYTAAAAMGQLRGLLRGIAVHSGEGPARILRGLDQAMRTLLIETTATAVVARLEQTDDERHRGITHVRWANAGHPPIMVINADGSVVALPGVDPDVLLGVDPESERREATITLDRGATILLFTDGLVERRDQDLTSGLDRLQRTLGELAHLRLDELCDQLLARLLPTTREDDVALIAVRLHRQDRPRPVEAGPNVVPDTVPDTPAVDPQAG
jgi:serine phosphatase RsbU (regulator of sigma subunit)